MQFTKTGRLVRSKRFEELHCGCDNDRRVPKRSQKPKIGAPELGQMVVRRYDLIRVFTWENERFLVNIHGLLNDVGVWQHNEDMTQPKRNRRLQEVSHNRGRLATPNRAVAGPYEFVGASRAARLVDLRPKNVSESRAVTQAAGVVIKSRQALLPTALSRAKIGLLPIVASRVRMIRINQATQEQPAFNACVLALQIREGSGTPRNSPAMAREKIR
jgi:hypothetical protein